MSSSGAPPDEDDVDAVVADAASKLESLQKSINAIYGPLDVDKVAQLQPEQHIDLAMASAFALVLTYRSMLRLGGGDIPAAVNQQLQAKITRVIDYRKKILQADVSERARLHRTAQKRSRTGAELSTQPAAAPAGQPAADASADAAALLQRAVAAVEDEDDDAIAAPRRATTRVQVSYDGDVVTSEPRGSRVDSKALQNLMKL